MKKIIITCLIGLLLNCTSFAQNWPQNVPFLMGYWSNWNIYSADQQSRAIPEPAYAIPGSIDETGAIVKNDDLQAKLDKINAITYDFFEVAQDGTVYFSDPWSDLRDDSQFANYDKLFNSGTGLCVVDASICNTAQQPSPYAKGNFQAFLSLNNQQNNLRKLISIGGFGHDDSFQHAFDNPNRFVQTVTEIVDKTGVDGVDLDFEPVTITSETAKKYADLIQQLRQSLPTDKLITMAVLSNPAWLENFGQDNWNVVQQNVNYVDLMTYDFHGGFDYPQPTGFLSSLYNDSQSPYHPDFSIDSSVKTLQQLGVPASKIVIGVPAYGRAQAEVPEGDQHGLFQPFKVIPQGDMDAASCSTDPTNTQTMCSGSFQYKYIEAQMLAKGFADFQYNAEDHGNVSSAVWAYDPDTWVVTPSQSYTGTYISYVNTNVAASEADYVKTHDLGGIMMWELRGDVIPGQPGSLWDAIDGQL